jgi:hypothetical protein
MAALIYRFSVTIPAGTPIATPQTTPFGLPLRIVTGVEVLIPPGPRGNVGWKITSDGLQVIPINAGSWFTADGEKAAWDLHDQPTNTHWECTAYNTGTFPHTLEFRFLTEVPQLVVARLGFQPLPIDSLAG